MSVLLDDKGNLHPWVGTGSDFWARPTNTYVGCTCPPARYSPTRPKPTDPDCPEHGTKQEAA